VRLNVRYVDSLPKLAWLAIVHRGTDTVEVTAGSWVESGDGFVCEGAWDGQYAGAEFDQRFFVGSGVKSTRNGAVLFSAPSHTLERLHVIRTNDSLVVSNSLAFALEATGDELDPSDLLMTARFHSIRYGLSEYVRKLPTTQRRVVELFYYCNLFVDKDLHLREEKKLPAPPFKDFAEYRAYLQNVTAGVCQNANDLARRVRYQPMATVSAGYDSPASAVIARAAGCTEALTFRDPVDGGTQIAARIGLAVTEHERTYYTTADGLPEAEFIAGGVTFSDAVMLCWQERLPRRMLITGFNGDHVWNRHTTYYTPDIVRTTLYTSGGSSGLGLAEFRLRVGFLHLPMPFIGITSAPSIHRISNSEEMRPWALDNDYDRPIPRRLVEESGVPRDWFGHKKTGSWLAVDREAGAQISQATRRAYTAYVRAHRSRGAALRGRLGNLLIYIYRRILALHHRIGQRLGNRPIRYWLQAVVTGGWAYWLTQPFGPHSFMPQWAIGVLKARYTGWRAPSSKPALESATVDESASGVR
jgi:hypothetical protein